MPQYIGDGRRIMSSRSSSPAWRGPLFPGAARGRTISGRRPVSVVKNQRTAVTEMAPASVAQPWRHGAGRPPRPGRAARRAPGRLRHHSRSAAAVPGSRRRVQNAHRTDRGGYSGRRRPDISGDPVSGGRHRPVGVRLQRSRAVRLRAARHRGAAERRRAVPDRSGRGRGPARAGRSRVLQINARDVSHVGIAVGGGRFVHAPSERGTVRVSLLAAPYWAKRYAGARRVGGG